MASLVNLDFATLFDYQNWFNWYILIGILFFVLVYLFLGFSWQRIAKRKRYKHTWFSWVPFLNLFMIYSLGGFSWVWGFLGIGILILPITFVLAFFEIVSINLFLVLISFVGVLVFICALVLFVISTWKIFEYFKYPGFLSLVILGIFIPVVAILFFIGHLIVLGFVAFKK